jgi:hypothetical protein
LIKGHSQPHPSFPSLDDVFILCIIIKAGLVGVICYGKCGIGLDLP